MGKPKTWTSWRVCPNCGDRSTKLFNLAAGSRPYKCQACGHRYDPPRKSRAKPGTVLHAEAFAYRGEGANGGCFFEIGPSVREGYAQLDVGWSCVVVHQTEIPITWLSELVAIATEHQDGIKGFLKEHGSGGINDNGETGSSYALMCDPENLGALNR